MGYGRRWAVETALSTYKRPYGEHTMSRKIENIEKRAEDKSIHIQHTNKHTDNTIKDKQKEKTDEVELGHKAKFFALNPFCVGVNRFSPSVDAR